MAPAPEPSKAKKDVEDIAKEAKSLIERILGDVSKSSAAKQLIIGTSTGWCTGVLASKVGKAAALALGGGIIAIQVAQHQGYININWDKVMKRVDKVSDRVEEKLTDEGPKWTDKIERYVDRKLDKAEDTLKRQKRQAKKWYHKVTGTGPDFQIEEVHIFLLSFVAGLAISVATS